MGSSSSTKAMYSPLVSTSSSLGSSEWKGLVTHVSPSLGPWTFLRTAAPSRPFFRVATWNIKWLGHLKKHVPSLVQTILASDADILFLQELVQSDELSADVQLLLSHLPSYVAYLSPLKRGKQHDKLDPIIGGCESEYALLLFRPTLFHVPPILQTEPMGFIHPLPFTDLQSKWKASIQLPGHFHDDGTYPGTYVPYIFPLRPYVPVGQSLDASHSTRYFLHVHYVHGRGTEERQRRWAELEYIVRFIESMPPVCRLHMFVAGDMNFEDEKEALRHHDEWTSRVQFQLCNRGRLSTNLISLHPSPYDDIACSTALAISPCVILDPPRRLLRHTTDCKELTTETYSDHMLLHVDVSWVQQEVGDPAPTTSLPPDRPVVQWKTGQKYHLATGCKNAKSSTTLPPHHSCASSTLKASQLCKTCCVVG